MPQSLRTRLRFTYSAATLAALVIGVNACSGDAPTASAPPSLTAPVANKVDDLLRFDADGDGHLSKAEKEAKKAAKEAEKRDFDALVKDWKAYKKAVKEGNLRKDLLRCEPEKREVQMKMIGPRGGKISVGRHELIIPAGALEQTIPITATVISGPVAEVEFQPHGLQFAVPVQLNMNYEHCLVPQGWEQSIVYLDNGFRILESRPSFDDDELREVSAWLDHFSGYAVATRTPTRE